MRKISIKQKEDIASDGRDARLSSLGGLGFLFNFEQRALPSKIIDGGSPRSQLAKRSDREGGKLVNETAIDQPSAHGFHLLLVCRSKWNERQRHRRSIAFRAVILLAGASCRRMESFEQSRKDTSARRRLLNDRVWAGPRLARGRRDWLGVAHDIRTSWIG